MLIEQAYEKMNAMKLFGMRDALSEQMELSSYDSLPFEERVGMLIDREWTDRENRKLERRMKVAKLKIAASMEDVDYRANRGLDQALMRSLADCRWVASHSTVLIVGPTGTGKTYLSCALADQALRKGYSALYFRAPRLFSALLLSRADGSWPRFLSKLEKADVLVVDDWGFPPSRTARGDSSWRSWRTGTVRARRSSHRSCRSHHGTRSSVSPRSPTPYWTVLCTTRTG
jgi:DNA replication protein DnaC